MSWNFGNASSTASGASVSSQITSGPDLEEVQTENLGFLSIAGETKLRLLPQSWPSDQLPPSTASLISISSDKGLLAAAGPDTLVVTSTESVRQAYSAQGPEENNTKSFSPQHTLSIPRVNQVAFSSDGSCLVIAAEEGGGLAIYDVQQLQQGQQQPAFQMPTNGIAVRQLAPNPAPELSHLFGLVLAGGQLVLANLKDRQLVAGSSGPIFREGVSCISWSAKGKQLVAGLHDGTATQYDHQGAVKLQIPAPPTLPGQTPVTAIYWLNNFDFFTVHTPSQGDNTDSIYHIIHYDKATTSFKAQKFASDPVPAFGTRFPAHQFIARLKSFPPHLEDTIILSSTAGTDIGVFTNASASLAPDMASDATVNAYTTTGMSVDSRRAQMPMSNDGMGDTSPIGMALDLSATEMVKRPIPSDEEIEQTATPLPALMILDNEGRLSTWWVAYTDSIRQKTAFPGLISAGSQSTPAMQSGAFQPIATPSTSATLAPAAQTTPSFGSSGFGQPARPAFGASSTPGFGGASALARQSPWGTPQQAAASPAKPAFGSTTPFGGAAQKTSMSNAAPASSQPAFGQASTFGSASPASGFMNIGSNQSAPFGSSNQTEKPAQSPFASFGSNKPAASPFASFANNDANKPASSPFASFANNDANKPAASPFASFGNNNTTSDTNKSTSSPFASFGKPSNSNQTSAFGGLGNNENKPSPFASFGQQASKPAPSFGSTVSLPSTTGGSFGAPSTIGASPSPFGAAAQNKASAFSNEATMSDDNGSAQNTDSQKPAQKPSPFGAFKLGSGFKGDGSAKDDLPPPKTPSTSLFGSSFGNLLGDTAKEPVTPIKKEPGTDEPHIQDISTTPATAPGPTSAPTPAKAIQPEAAPLPPDFTKMPASKAHEPDDAPLPPDFTNAAPIKSIEAEDAPLPPDFTKSSQKVAEPDVPLPPDFLITKPKQSQEEDLPPIAGSPPVDLGRDGSPDLSPVENDGDDEGLEEEEEEDEDDLEEDEEDEEEEQWEDEEPEDEEEDDDEEDQGTPQSSRSAATPASNAFGSRLTFPGQDQASNTAKSPIPSTTPAGLPKGPIFAPPIKESPRSPSPIRSMAPPAARPTSRQGAAPSFGISQSRSNSHQSARPVMGSQPATQQPQKPLAQPAVPEIADLQDDEDARIREILASDIEPTKTLDAFIAHQDYVGDRKKSGISAQIENVYRDINSMIDTIGLNARTLEAFVRGQEELFQQSGRERTDLEDAEEWTLVELDDLQNVEIDLGRDLEDGRVMGVPEKMNEINAFYNETARLKAKAAETRRQLAARTDPDKRAMQRNAPLDTDTEMQQAQLRQTVAKAQKLLQEAEEALSVLRADLASAPSNDTSSHRATPTVEAVTNTILKMTAMIEQKSGDVDVLESQIRRLPHGLADLTLDDGEEDLMRSSTFSLRSSRRGLPASKSMNALSTPGRDRRSVLNGEALGMSGMLGSRFRTPPGRRSMHASSGSPAESMIGGSARKKMSEVTSEDVSEFNRRREHRRKILGSLREIVESKGTRVVGVQ